MNKNIIEIDATKWRSSIDFYKSLFEQIGAPDWHGESTDALVDSMIYGGINTVEPPYTIRILGLDKLSASVADEVRAAKQALEEARHYRHSTTGADVNVGLEIA